MLFLQSGSARLSAWKCHCRDGNGATSLFLRRKTDSKAQRKRFFIEILQSLITGKGSSPTIAPSCDPPTILSLLCNCKNAIPQHPDSAVHHGMLRTKQKSLCIHQWNIDYIEGSYFSCDSCRLHRFSEGPRMYSKKENFGLVDS